MSVPMYRNDVIMAIVNLFQNSDRRYLSQLDRNDIMYAEKNYESPKVVLGKREIWVAPIEDQAQAVDSAREDHRMQVSAVVMVKSPFGVTDKKSVINLCEDCEWELLENRTLPSTVEPAHTNGHIKGSINMRFVSVFVDNDTLNFGQLTFTVNKLTSVY